MSKGYVPFNTEKKHSSCFSQWKSARNKSVAVVEGKGDLLDNPNMVLLKFWIPSLLD